MNKLESDYVFFSDWINYWYGKQSVFVKKINEDNYKTLTYGEVLNMFYDDEAKSNLFFSINGYKYGAKTRDEKNIEKINCFYFDIDMQDNKMYKKEEIKNILEKFLDYFDVCSQSRNGFHMYILLEEGQYNIKDKDKYIEDWKEKGKEIEKLLGVTLDKSIYSLSRISRIPLSNHQKKGDSDFFEIEYMKGKEIISPLKLRESKINDIDIVLVINKLYDEKLNDIYVLNDKIYRGDEESSGLKIHKAKNYIRDFSRDDFEGSNFDIVRKIFNDKLSDTIKDKNKLYSETLMKTFNFFAKHFGIISINELKFNIIISAKIQEQLNNINISGEEIKYFLGLLNFSQGKSNTINYYGKKQEIEILNFINYNGFVGGVTKSKEILEKLSKNKELDKILNLEILKKENKLFIKFTILPGYFAFTQKEKNKYFRNHFIDKRILTNSIKQNYFSLFFMAIRKVVCNNKIDEYSLSNNEIKKKIGDTNLQRIKKNIKDISKNIGGLNISFVGKEIIFKKK